MMETRLNTVSTAPRWNWPSAPSPSTPRPTTAAKTGDVYLSATASEPIAAGGGDAAPQGVGVTMLQRVFQLVESLLSRLEAFLHLTPAATAPAPATQTPAAPATPSPGPAAAAPATPSPAPAAAAPAPVQAPDKPATLSPTPATPPSAPVQAPAAPSGSKPPLLAQFIQKGDPATNTYGHSGANWIGEGNPDDIHRVIREATAQNQTPVFVQYDIPDRDKGGGSAGGAATVEAYAAVVEKNAKAIGDAPAVIVIEPDALALGLDPSTVKRALEIFKANCPNARLYLDAGNSAWCSVDEITDKLMQAGIQEADGFSLNVSGFQWTNDSTAYGDKIVAALTKRDPSLASKQFLVDTSRNGNGTGVDENGHDTWGDPVRAKRGGPMMNGPFPTTTTGDPHCVAFMWIKPPGFGDLRTRSCFQFGGTDWIALNPQPPLGPT